MSNSPNQTPNPNRRRRLTADELIAIVVALTGIGSVLLWGIGQQYHPQNLFSKGVATLGGETASKVRSGSATDESSTRQRTQIATSSSSTATTVQASPLPAPVAAPATIVKTVEVPAPIRTTTAPIAVLPIPVAPIATQPVFTDVPKQSWAETYIEELRKRGILADFGTGKFEPSKPITRGEYAKMLDRAFADRANIATTSEFKDIPAGYPRKEAIDKSVKIGFMTGYSPTIFAPRQTIPRYQLQISLAKGLGLKIPADSEQILSKFSDANYMPKYAREKMAAAIANGLVINDGTKNLLKPQNDATRADAAALVYQSLVQEGKIQLQPQP